MIVHDTKRILSKYDRYAKKMYGQNFLIDPNILNFISQEAHLTKEIGVIEVGPGLGALTEVLAIHAKKVLAYEIDETMVEILNDTLSGYSNVQIIHQDILKANIQEDILTYFEGVHQVIVVSNLPYYITTPIVFKFLEETKIDFYVLMVQKEVAQRLTGKPSTKDYNALSVYMKYKTNSKMLKVVPPKCFYPEPKVESALLSIQTVENDYGINNEPKFAKFIQLIFAQRRKTMINNMSVAYGIDKASLAQTLEKLGFLPTVRSEALSIEDIVTIYKNIFE